MNRNTAETILGKTYMADQNQRESNFVPTSTFATPIIESLSTSPAATQQEKSPKKALVFDLTTLKDARRAEMFVSEAINQINNSPKKTQFLQRNYLNLLQSARRQIESVLVQMERTETNVVSSPEPTEPKRIRVSKAQKLAAALILTLAGTFALNTKPANAQAQRTSIDIDGGPSGDGKPTDPDDLNAYSPDDVIQAIHNAILAARTSPEGKGEEKQPQAQDASLVTEPFAVKLSEDTAKIVRGQLDRFKDLEYRSADGKSFKGSKTNIEGGVEYRLPFIYSRSWIESNPSNALTVKLPLMFNPETKQLLNQEMFAFLLGFNEEFTSGGVEAVYTETKLLGNVTQFTVFLEVIDPSITFGGKTLPEGTTIIVQEGTHIPLEAGKSLDVVTVPVLNGVQSERLVMTESRLKELQSQMPPEMLSSLKVSDSVFVWKDANGEIKYIQSGTPANPQIYKLVRPGDILPTAVPEESSLVVPGVNGDLVFQIIPVETPEPVRFEDAGDGTTAGGGVVEPSESRAAAEGAIANLEKSLRLEANSGLAFSVVENDGQLLLSSNFAAEGENWFVFDEAEDVWVENAGFEGIQKYLKEMPAPFWEKFKGQRFSFDPVTIGFKRADGAVFVTGMGDKLVKLDTGKYSYDLNDDVEDGWVHNGKISTSSNFVPNKSGLKFGIGIAEKNKLNQALEFHMSQKAFDAFAEEILKRYPSWTGKTLIVNELAADGVQAGDAKDIIHRQQIDSSINPFSTRVQGYESGALFIGVSKANNDVIRLKYLVPTETSISDQVKSIYMVILQGGVYFENGSTTEVPSAEHNQTILTIQDQVFEAAGGPDAMIAVSQ